MKWPKIIRKESLHETVVRQLALQILKESATTLPNGDDLANELQVSRTVLRESIKVLVAKGLLEVGPKTGTRVRPRKDWNLLDPQVLEWISESGIDEYFLESLVEFRSVLEPKAAELAALRATENDLQEMQSAWEEMRQGSNDREAYNAGDVRFHQAVLAASHNDLFLQVGGLTRVLLRMSIGLTSTSSEHFSTSLPPHKDVLDAIVNRDPAAAKKYMEGVISLATAEVREFFGCKGDQRWPVPDKTPIGVARD